MTTPFHRGQFVRITYGERTIDGMVLLASTNNKSLMLGFKGTLGEDEGMFFGSMPVLMDDDGVYRDLVLNQSVRLELKARQ